MTVQDSRGSRLAEHVDECAACRAESLPLDRLSLLLAEDEVPVDTEALSCRALVQLRPELRANASRALQRRMVRALLVSVVPLALVLGYDVFVLGLLHGLLQHFLPSGLATYIVFSQFALISLLFAATYAAIPLLVLAHRSTTPKLAH
jgi:hypothetical protein